MQMILPNCHQVKELKLMIVIHFLISCCTSETLHSTFNILFLLVNIQSILANTFN